MFYEGRKSEVLKKGPENKLETLHEGQVSFSVIDNPPVSRWRDPSLDCVLNRFGTKGGDVLPLYQRGEIPQTHS